jgi:hypothetical protein
MRRLLVVASTALVVLAGCGSERPGSTRDVAASFSPAPSPGPTAPTRTPTLGPTQNPTPTTASEVHGPLAGFPLDLDYARENGDDHSPVRITARPGVEAIELCGQTAWDPHAGTTDVIGVHWDAEAEWSRGRTLALYPSVDAARAAVDTARDVVTSCPVGKGDGYAEHTLVDYVAGDQSVGWIDRYWSSDAHGFDTGLTVYHAARVGRAVLVSFEYGEGNGSAQTRQEAIAAAAKGDQYVVDAMADLG